jgi:hypothetical protein
MGHDKFTALTYMHTGTCFQVKTRTANKCRAKWFMDLAMETVEPERKRWNSDHEAWLVEK